MAPPPADPTSPRTPGGFLRRLTWLLLCAGTGALIGAIGHALTGEPAWYVAISVVIALGWLAWADPTACRPPGEREH
ncbi:hypothetical protein [Ideonella sp. A 288]|uniref:hypothetical protein n=1 Tax=Ideonella sp. A 288 TaxID=1962181 RepID=UPI000B4AE5D1|nr:hypothetical protein [Ideonella sp. A 288]